MKTKQWITGLLLMTAMSMRLEAQQPVKWTFHTKKLADRTYELQMIASMESGWHIYSQEQPPEAINVPTKISFQVNPMIMLDGKVKEQGDKKKYENKELGISAWQYQDRVTFIQTVKLRGNVKTSVSGRIQFQTCTDERCLPPATQNFNIELNEGDVAGSN